MSTNVTMVRTIQREDRHDRIHSIDTDRVLTTGRMVTADATGTHWRLEIIHSDGTVTVSRHTACGREVRRFRADAFQCELHADEVKLALTDLVKASRYWALQIMVAVLAALVGLYVTHLIGA